MPALAEEFSYVVGRPWHDGDDRRGVCAYTYFGEVQHGTLNSAKDFLNYAEEKSGVKHYIYRLVRLEETI